MKKLTFYFLISLFFITNVLADQLAVVDIKLETKLTDYFTTAQISKYHSDVPFYSYDGKYSHLRIKKESNHYTDDYDWVDIYYANKNDEIARITVTTNFKFNNVDGFNQCIEFRNQKVSEYKKKNILIGFTADPLKMTHPDKVVEDSIVFRNPLKRITIGYMCYDYLNSVVQNPDKEYITDFRIVHFTYDHDSWFREQYGKLYK